MNFTDVSSNILDKYIIYCLKFSKTHGFHDFHSLYKVYIRRMIFFIFFALLAGFCTPDCPLNHYPRQTVIGYVQAEIDSDPQLHNQALQYNYQLTEPLPSLTISVAISIIGFELIPSESISFKVKHLPTSNNKNSLVFGLQVDDKNYGWRFLKFSFLGTQNILFSMTYQENIRQFSTGLEEGLYSVYRVIPDYNKFSSEPVIKIFLSGLQADKSSTNSSEIQAMQDQLITIKLFSGNPKLITLMQQSLQIQKGFQFAIKNSKTVGRLLAFNIYTNLKINSLSFSYIIYSNTILREKHDSIIGDFTIVDGNQHKFSLLSNMDMMLAGLTQFTLPSESLYSFQVNFQEIFNQGYFSLQTNKPHFKMGFHYLALEMQRQYVCQDCLDSPIIYQEKYCVHECPRGYSKVQRLQSIYCDKCELQKLKIVDQSGLCVCANRHYLDLFEDVCKPCTYDCMTCQTSTTCETCDNNMLQTKRTMNTEGRCVCPIIGYYDNILIENIVCQKCDQNCRTCNGPRAHDCLTCDQGKQIDYLGFCVCTNGFQKNIDGQCYCPPPKVLFSGFCTTNSIECGPNMEAQLVDLTRNCLCKAGFVQVLNECIKCQGNSSFDEDELKCKCVNQTVYINGECVPCGINEIFDEFSNRCVCDPTAFKSNDGKCIKCPLKMVYVNNKCQCPFNYFQNGSGLCEKCKRSSDGPLCRKSSIIQI